MYKTGILKNFINLTPFGDSRCVVGRISRIRVYKRSLFFLLPALIFANALCADFFDDLIDVLDSVAGPRVDNAVFAEKNHGELTRNVDGVFAEDTPSIYVIAAISGFQPSDKLRCVWYYVEDGDLARIKEMNVKVGSDKEKGFHLEIKEGAKWPEGRYRVDLHHGETLLKSVEFTVKADTTASSGAVWGGVGDAGKNPESGSGAAPVPSGGVENKTVSAGKTVKKGSDPLIEQRVESMIRGVKTKFSGHMYSISNDFYIKTAAGNQGTCRKCRKGRMQPENFRWICSNCGNAGAFLADMESSNGKTYRQWIIETEKECLEEEKRYKKMGNKALAENGHPPAWDPDEKKRLINEELLKLLNGGTEGKTKPGPEKKETEEDFDFVF